MAAKLLSRNWWPSVNGIRVSRFVLLISLATTALNASRVDGALIANWRLDDSSGAAVNDTNATFNGIVSGTQNQPGKIGTAYSFSGGTNVNVNPGGSGAPAAPAPSPVGTISAWINPTASGNTGNIVYLQSPTFIQFRIESGNNLTYRQDGGHDRVVSSAADAIPDGEWTHVVALIDPAFIRLYRNGVQIANGAGSNGYVSSDATLLQIGAGAGNNFQGSIDDVALWNTVLSVGKIGTLSNILGVNGGALSDYNALMMDKLFTAYDSNTTTEVSSTSGTLDWAKFTGGSGVAGTVTYDGSAYRAWFTDTDGVEALTLSAVPEPQTVALALGGAAGLAGLLLLRRRQSSP